MSKYQRLILVLQQKLIFNVKITTSHIGFIAKTDTQCQNINVSYWFRSKTLALVIQMLTFHIVFAMEQGAGHTQAGIGFGRQNQVWTQKPSIYTSHTRRIPRFNGFPISRTVGVRGRDAHQILTFHIGFIVKLDFQPQNIHVSYWFYSKS